MNHTAHYFFEAATDHYLLLLLDNEAVTVLGFVEMLTVEEEAATAAPLPLFPPTHGEEVPLVTVVEESDVEGAISATAIDTCTPGVLVALLVT